jgi:hypothetical protein
MLRSCEKRRMQVGNVPRVHGKMHGKVSKGAIAGKTGNNYDGPKRRKANNFRVLPSQQIPFVMRGLSVRLRPLALGRSGFA